jgi:predicted O-methyltransferase YrrM
MSRFHTSSGTFVGWRNLPHGAISITQVIVRKATGRIPRQPWIPFAARNALQSILTPEAVVWEIGAGFSTLWLAERVKKVTSVEAAREWYERLTAQLAREAIRNVDLRFEWQAERMADFSELHDGSLDLLFVDGGPRGRCLANGFSKVRRGGYVYLDNWDTKEFWEGEADFADRHAAQISWKKSFVDYVPAQFGVYEGLLLRKA